MKHDLDQLKGEIEAHLKSQEFVVFQGHSRISGSTPFVYWDTDRHPDFRGFLDVARQCGVKLIVFHHREFTRGYLEDAMERLEAAELPRDEQRALERRIKALRDYEGFTCHLELSFDWQGRVYYYSLRTEWYEDLLDALEEIDAAFTEDDEEEGEGPVSGYFSRN